MADQTILPNTPKPKRSPPPPPPPPRVSGNNSPSLRCTSPASSCNSHQYAASCRGSTTGSATSSYCHGCHGSNLHIHNNYESMCQSMSSSASAHGGFASYNQMHTCHCSQMVYPSTVCRKQYPHRCSSNLSSTLSQTSQGHCQQHNNNYIHAPLMPLHGQYQCIVNQPQDFLETSSVTSTSSVGRHHNLIQNMCSGKPMYPKNDTRAHRPCPPTPDQFPKTPEIPPTPPCQHNATINRQAKPPVPSVRSLQKSLLEISIPDNSIKPQLSPLPNVLEDDGNINQKYHKCCSEKAYMFSMARHYGGESRYLLRKQRRHKLESDYNNWQEKSLTFEECLRRFYKRETNNLRLKRKKMSIEDFEKKRLIGRGVIGDVFLVKMKPNHPCSDESLYAMKELEKKEVLSRNQMANVWAERDFLAIANNEWVVKMFYSFQDLKNLYFIMEYFPGGDMMTLLEDKGTFTEEQAKFYIAELSLAVQYVHNVDVIHRDIKPDNILIDRNGHIKLADFGLITGFKWHHDIQCYNTDENTDEPFYPDKTLTQDLSKRQHQQKQKKHYTGVGSTSYMSPEAAASLRPNFGRPQPRTKLCDWWSVGVILYEMIVGYCPFKLNGPENEEDLRIVQWGKFLEIPTHLSKEAQDLLRGLLNDKEVRLCRNGIADMKVHQFFDNLDWDRIRNSPAPFTPKLEDHGLNNFPENTLLGKYIYKGRDAETNLERNHCFNHFYEWTFTREY